jgi:branched-chain amino acid transport system permease protein
VRVVHSPYGQVLKAIRENEPRAISLGYTRRPLQAAGLRAVGGLGGTGRRASDAGARLRNADDAYWTMSGLVVLMTLGGRHGTMFGPLLGAFIIVALENRLGDIGAGLSSNLTGVDWFRSLGESVTIVTGLIFIACVLLFRRGIVERPIKVLTCTTRVNARLSVLVAQSNIRFSSVAPEF